MLNLHMETKHEFGFDKKIIQFINASNAIKNLKVYICILNLHMETNHEFGLEKGMRIFVKHI